ncbi:ABC transporter ATP-binding protein [Varunaivibrio sulfuroxidans]|uniref:Lipoprotein-releasing system ATP-binding protein n=1 Tax=Varunaivibrio sulfuroxidans TaxID=1773489 RepID=A0A4R3JDP4_9PROT|nr:ABC transporter ATP-binding protein [Varunaivibrio sulfuroxidans]TCS64148.1 lipoprotein-releasing system ATP-binding protein [Varunaivibrio sulfuroxidans]WES31405.1 ABC transporter ATP-binding protein [Varunaivibrio sulfuroxidans]
MSNPVLALSAVRRTFLQGRDALEVLKGCDLVIHPGEIVALVGPSGAGKSTLLQIAGLLEKPDGGVVCIVGEDCTALGDDRLTAMRRDHLGFVYQYHHLLAEFSALENIAIPQIIAGRGKAEARGRAAKMLDALGLAARADHRPARLSGGEQQRVAIGRALANGPSLLLADEPTGNLDPDTAGTVFDMLLTLARDAGLAALIATHNPDLAARMDRTVRLEDGHLVAV